jgi:hypothetical protein
MGFGRRIIGLDISSDERRLASAYALDNGGGRDARYHTGARNHRVGSAFPVTFAFPAAAGGTFL